MGTYDLLTNVINDTTMKISKKYAVPMLALGIMVAGGTTALAAVGPDVALSTLTGFSDAQKAAIEKAFQIHKTADAEAKAVLDAAGVDPSKLHEAMRSQHEAGHAKMDAALDANDFAAFQALAVGTPMADKVTSETFAKLVEIRKLEKAGDKEGAMELRKELGGGMGMKGMGGPRGPGMQR